MCKLNYVLFHMIAINSRQPTMLIAITNNKVLSY